MPPLDITVIKGKSERLKYYISLWQSLDNSVTMQTSVFLDVFSSRHNCYHLYRLVIKSLHKTWKKGISLCISHLTVNWSSKSNLTKQFSKQPCLFETIQDVLLWSSDELILSLKDLVTQHPGEQKYWLSELYGSCQSFRVCIRAFNVKFNRTKLNSS